jgi:hypothetical protein
MLEWAAAFTKSLRMELSNTFKEENENIYFTAYLNDKSRIFFNFFFFVLMSV